MVEPAGMDAEARLLETLARRREYKRAAFVPGGAVVQASQRLFARNKDRKTWIPLPADGSPRGFAAPEDLVVWQPSPSGALNLVCRKSPESRPGAASVSACTWEVLNRAGDLVYDVAVPPSVHGAVYPEGYVSRGVSWSPCEQFVAYVAEAPSPFKTPAWGGVGPRDAGDACKGAPGSWSGQGPYEEDLGELFEGKRRAAVFVMRLGVDGGDGIPCPRIARLDPLPAWSSGSSDPYGHFSSASCGKPSWSHDSRVVAFTAWPHVQHAWPVDDPALASSPSPALHTSQKLGLVYCYNRACHLFAVKMIDVLAALDDAKEGGEEGKEGKEGGEGGLGAGAVTAWPLTLAADGGRPLPALPASCHSAVFAPPSEAQAEGKGKEGKEGGEGEASYTLYFLSHATALETGVHNACAALHGLRLEGDADAPLSAWRVLSPASLNPIVPALTTPSPLPLPARTGEAGEGKGEEGKGWEGGGGGMWRFAGLYCADIPEGACLGSHVFLNCVQGSRAVVVAVDVRTGKALPVHPEHPPQWPKGAGPASYQTLAVGNGRLAAAVSSYAHPPAVLEASLAELASLTDSAAPDTAPDALLAQPWRTLLQPSHPPLDACITVVPLTGEDGGMEPFEYVLARPADPAATGGAVLLIPHGGPHSAHACAWLLQYAFLLELGYTLVFVNYRGSIGAGDGPLLSLPGRIGAQDVADCMHALRDALAHLGDDADSNRVAVMGGSHGGFLTLHLLGQHPEAFRAGVVRNPVASLPGMISSTDIPEWCYVEALGSGARPRDGPPTTEEYGRMLSCSPIVHVGAVKAPTLWLLGKNDKRVKPYAAMEYVAALRAKGLPVKVIMFPKDSHPLSSPQTEFESHVNIAWWLKEHMPM